MCSASSTRPSHTSGASSQWRSLSGRPERWATPAWPTRWSATQACPAALRGAPPAKPRSSPQSPRWPARWPAGTSMPTRPKPSPEPTSATRHGASWWRPLRARGPTRPASGPRSRRSQPDTRPPNNASCASAPTGSCGSTTTVTEWCALRGRSTPTAGPGSRPRSPPSPTVCGAPTSNSPRTSDAPPNNETSTLCARPHPNRRALTPPARTPTQTADTTNAPPCPALATETSLTKETSLSRLRPDRERLDLSLEPERRNPAPQPQPPQPTRPPSRLVTAQRATAAATRESGPTSTMVANESYRCSGSAPASTLCATGSTAPASPTAARLSPLRHCDASPATPRSSPPCSTPKDASSTSAGAPGASARHCAAPSSPATAAVYGPAVTPRRRDVTRITSSTGPTADPPTPTTWRCCATATTSCCTRAATTSNTAATCGWCSSPTAPGSTNH